MVNFKENEELKMKNILAVYLHSAAKFFILRSSFFIINSYFCPSNHF